MSHVVFFLKQGILSEMFYFKLLKKSKTWHLPPVKIKSEALNTFFYSENDFQLKSIIIELKKIISEKTFLQVSKMLTLIISYSNIVYLVSNFPSFLDLLCYRGNSVFLTIATIRHGNWSFPRLLHRRKHDGKHSYR